VIGGDQHPAQHLDDVEIQWRTILGCNMVLPLLGLICLVFRWNSICKFCGETKGLEWWQGDGQTFWRTSRTFLVRWWCMTTNWECEWQTKTDTF
jgi:hypothetical protein